MVFSPVLPSSFLAHSTLRQGYNILKGYAQMLLIQSKRKKSPLLVDWQIEALQGIDQATQRLVELTEDLLDVTRLQAGRTAAIAYDPNRSDSSDKTRHQAVAVNHRDAYVLACFGDRARRDRR